MSKPRFTLLAGLALTFGSLAAPSVAQHEGHDMPGPTASPTPAGTAQPNLAPQPGWPSPVMDDMPFSLLLFDQFEYVPSEGSLYWDMVGWWGGDYERFWVKSEGTTGLALSEGEVELQALYGRLVTSYFDAQAGLRVDRVWRAGGAASRAQVALGLQGLAPFLYEVEPALFVSQTGDLSARVTLSRSLLLTQRTMLQLKLETDAALQAVPSFGVGTGLNELNLGLRLRHEIRREFAPYLGLDWTQRFGQAAQFAQQAGEPSGVLSLVTGIRWWF